MASGVDTHTHTYFGGMKVISRNQARAGLKIKIPDIVLARVYNRTY